MLAPRALFLILFSIGLMSMDYRWAFFANIRFVLNAIVTPVHYIVDFPVNIITNVRDGLSANQSLAKENANLRVQQTLLQAKIQRLLSVEKENSQLRALLGSSPKIKGKVLVGQVLAVDSDPFLQQVIINHGSTQHVYVGQAVLDARGIMGQVIAVSPWTSRVMLLNDVRSGIPVSVLRNNVRAVAVGDGSTEQLKLVNIPVTADIKVQDKLVSSGLGLRYPAGYPVGSVTKISHQKGAPYLEVSVKPAAELNRSRLILLVWPQRSKIVSSAKQQMMEIKRQHLADENKRVAS